MNIILTAAVNGAILSLPVVAMVWGLLHLFRRYFNAATRYIVWWITLLVVTVIPLLLLPPRVASLQPMAIATPALTVMPLPSDFRTEISPASVSVPIRKERILP